MKTTGIALLPLLISSAFIASIYLPPHQAAAQEAQAPYTAPVTNDQAQQPPQQHMHTRHFEVPDELKTRAEKQKAQQGTQQPNEDQPAGNAQRSPSQQAWQRYKELAAGLPAKQQAEQTMQSATPDARAEAKQNTIANPTPEDDAGTGEEGEEAAETYGIGAALAKYKRKMSGAGGMHSRSFPVPESVKKKSADSGEDDIEDDIKDQVE